jgi:hypothetical protein
MAYPNLLKETMAVLGHLEALGEPVEEAQRALRRRAVAVHTLASLVRGNTTGRSP